MAKFKSVYNDTVIVEFTSEFDIREMRKHQEYIEVTEPLKDPQSHKQPTKEDKK